MQIISTVALISINETLLVQLVSFLIFVFILNRIMVRPLNSTMKDREFYMEGMEKEIKDAGRTMKDVQEKIHHQEADARRSAQEAREQIEHAGHEEAARIFSEAQGEIASLRETAHKEVSKKIAEAKTQIQQEAVGLAETMMEKALDRRVAQ